MATIYDGSAIAKGSKLQDGAWGWSDFGWHTSLPTTLASFCPEIELAKARKNPAFAEWLGQAVGNDGAQQAEAAARNADECDARAAAIVANSPQVMNHGGKISVGLCEDGE
jgi:hypothetical protein